jgi:glycosyltransferase involved in cell wall biosynthesis
VGAGSTAAHQEDEHRAAAGALTPRVTLLSHGFQSEYEIGLANGLARSGVKVILVGSDNTLSDRASQGVSILNLRGSQSPDRSGIAKLRNLTRYVWAYLRLLGKTRGTPVHVIGMFSTRSTAISLVEAWLTRLVGGRYLLTVHNLLPHNRRTALNRAAYGLIYRAPAMLMVHTRRMARELADLFGIAPSRIVVVEHGFDRIIEYEPEARAAWRGRQGIPSDAEIILFFGYIERYKGLDLLLEAFKQAGAGPSRHLVIAGQCSDAALRSELEDSIRDHPFARRIHWLDGFVPHGQIAGLLHAADCLAMPYRHIDQSGVLLLALSSGLPFVSTDVGAMVE